MPPSLRRGLRGRRAGPAVWSTRPVPPCVPAAGSTPIRSWPTTWRTPRRPSPPPAPRSTYGALGETEGRLATAFVADVLADLVGRVAGREAAWGTQRRLDRAGGRLPARGPRPGHLGCAGQRRGAAASRERLRARPRDVPPLRRGQGAPPCRARPPDQRRYPRGDHQRPGRTGRVRALGPRGVRRLRHRRRE